MSTIIFSISTLRSINLIIFRFFIIRTLQVITCNNLTKAKLTDNLSAINFITTRLATHGFHEKMYLFLALLKAIKSKKDFIILQASDVIIKLTNGGKQFLPFLIKRQGLL